MDVPEQVGELSRKTKRNIGKTMGPLMLREEKYRSHVDCWRWFMSTHNHQKKRGEPQRKNTYVKQRAREEGAVECHVLVRAAAYPAQVQCAGQLPSDERWKRQYKVRWKKRARESGDTGRGPRVRRDQATGQQSGRRMAPRASVQQVRAGE